MKNIIRFSALLFAFKLSCFAQINLVPNGGFETASPCPNYGAQINYATGWNNVNLVYGNPYVGTPDFFHTCGCCGVQPPNTFASTCSPKTGNGYAGTVLYNIPYPDYREYMSTKLTCKMVAGSTYTVSFSLTNGTVPQSPYIIKNIGAYFSVAPLSQSGWGLISLTPQCEITGYSGSTSWVTYSFVINASANWEYITLGCFRPDASNSPVSTFTGTSGPNSAYANYFWDDISVIGPGMPSSPFNLNTTANNTSCFGSSNGSATVSTTSTLSLTYNWMPGNINGQVANNLSAGIYTVTATDGGCNSNTGTVSIGQPSQIAVSIDPLTLCAGTQGSLNANVSGGTPAYTYSWNTGSTSPGIIIVPSTTTTYTLYITDSNSCTNFSITTVTVSSCTGIQEKQNAASIELYPNPVTDLLYIDTKMKYDEVIITNLLGKQVKRLYSQIDFIDMSEFSDGIYFISIYSNKKMIITKKIIKQE